MLSTFAQHLGTNYCPSEDEVLEVKNLIAEPTRQLLTLDEEISQLQKSIEKLQEKRKTLSTYVDEYKALISPIRRIPQDVLSEIFIACLPTHRNCVMSASEAPVLLGRICSSWRALSLATPRLWASLHIVEPRALRSGLYDDKIDQRLEVMKMWLGRSGQCPLSISFHCTEYYAAPADDESTGILPHPVPVDVFPRELVSFARRWRRVSFMASLPALHAMAALTAADVPMLQSVSVFVHSPHENSLARFGILEAPRISSFAAYTGELYTSESEWLPLRWDLLTNLEFQTNPWEMPLNVEKALELLSSCPQLRSCNLPVGDVPGDPTNTLSRDPPVELLHLHTLKLSMIRGGSSFLKKLYLPNLRKFVIRGNAQDSLPQFLRSSISLESLDIDGPHYSKTSQLEVLRAVSPTMRHLIIRDFWGPSVARFLDDEFMEMLTPVFHSSTDISQCCCPSLESLTVACRHDISDWAVEQFVVRRMSTTDCSTPSLKRVRFQFNRPMKLDITPSLKPFMDAGLEVEMMYSISRPSHLSPWFGLADSRESSTPEVSYPAHW
ncbi:hypothetical protein R3P38DRAFT_3049167 [Favolaschia claudopus]|uniref:F-box domain-containing protein n=1 Tax=Favolaschia claudopus TaxID=2862362 RepID=A0AAW0A700_9AGAR